MTRIFVLGGPSKVGGANGECLGAVALWRKFGLDVDFIPTWGRPEPDAIAQCESLGCRVHFSGPRFLHEIEGFAGSTVVSFCNDNAFAANRELKRLGCRHIFAPLMCFLTKTMQNALTNHFVDAIVFQSNYQSSVLRPRISSLGYSENDFHLVRGYIDWEQIPFCPRPHNSGEPFFIGRAARPRASKWTQDWWKMYEQVPNRNAVLLGVDAETIRQIGRAPEWAETHKPGSLPASSFWPILHAHVTCNASDKENWPRTGLECMAYGVPTCAENRFGWREMIQHPSTGLLGDTPMEIGKHAAALACDEELRMEIVAEARRRLETDISNPDAIWSQWKGVLAI